MRRFLFPIEAGQVLHFARAIGDPDPVFRDPNYAALALSDAVVPPPTFLIAAHHFDPQSFLRPSPGEAVPGAGVVMRPNAATKIAPMTNIAAPTKACLGIPPVDA